MRPLLITVAVFSGFALFAAGFVFVSFEFGLSGALALSLLLIPTLVVAARLHHRRPAVRRREFVFLVIVVCATSGGIAFVVWDWYAAGMDSNHAEDVKWAALERLVRQDPSFQRVRINLSDGKHIHWASGTVASEADLDRLRSLAERCGIENQRLDGPLTDSSVRVKLPDRAAQDR